MKNSPSPFPFALLLGWEQPRVCVPRFWEVQVLRTPFPGAAPVGFVPCQVQQEKVPLLSQRSERTSVSLSLVLGCLRRVTRRCNPFVPAWAGQLSLLRCPEVVQPSLAVLTLSLSGQLREGPALTEPLEFVLPVPVPGTAQLLPIPAWLQPGILSPGWAVPPSFLLPSPECRKSQECPERIPVQARAQPGDSQAAVLSILCPLSCAHTLPHGTGNIPRSRPARSCLPWLLQPLAASQESRLEVVPGCRGCNGIRAQD